MMMNESLLMSKTADAKDHDSASPIRTVQPVRESPESDLNVLRRTVQKAGCNDCGPSSEAIAAELVGMHPTHRSAALRGLQQTRGNRYVGHLAVQAKLAVGQPGDKYEQEADRVAEAVMRMPHSGGERKMSEEAAETISDLSGRRSYSLEDETAMSALEASVKRARSGGRPLSGDVRAAMEQAFDFDFSGVKIHTDAQSDGLNRSLKARAFTVGKDVFFRHGTYRPGSRRSLGLLAHELTHVVQQNKGGIVGEAVQRNPEFQRELEIEMPPPNTREAREMIQARRRRLRQICESLSPSEADRLYTRLNTQGDYLSDLFNRKLHHVVRGEILAILRRRRRRTPEPEERIPERPPRERGDRDQWIDRAINDASLNPKQQDMLRYHQQGSLDGRLIPSGPHRLAPTRLLASTPNLTDQLIDEVARNSDVNNRIRRSVEHSHNYERFLQSIRDIEADVNRSANDINRFPAGCEECLADSSMRLKEWVRSRQDDPRSVYHIFRR